MTRETSHNNPDNLTEGLKQGLELESLNRPCQYHQLPGHIPREKILPADSDPVIQYLLYPYLLATVYGADSGKINCFKDPRDTTRGLIKIERSGLNLTEKIKNLVKTIISPIIPMGRVSCNAHVRGARSSTPFDLGSGGTLCPAAFRSFFPLSAIQSFERTQKGASDISWRASCPDHIKNCVFGDTEDNAEINNNICFRGNTARIKTVNNCKYGTIGQASSIEEISDTLGCNCPTLLNVALAYYITLAQGGELAFYSRSFDAAIFQCPNPNSRVVVEITRLQASVELKVLEVIGGNCPRQIEKGRKFVLAGELEENSFCIHAFNVLYFFSGLIDSSGKALKVQCLLPECEATWEISSSLEE